jgi:hypothetical protein
MSSLIAFFRRMDRDRSKVTLDRSRSSEEVLEDADAGVAYLM